MTGTVGQSKIEVMAERVKLINPECKVNLIDDFITPDNQHEYGQVIVNNCFASVGCVLVVVEDIES